MGVLKEGEPEPDVRIYLSMLGAKEAQLVQRAGKTFIGIIFTDSRRNPDYPNLVLVDAEDSRLRAKNEVEFLNAYLEVASRQFYIHPDGKHGTFCEDTMGWFGREEFDAQKDLAIFETPEGGLVGYALKIPFGKGVEFLGNWKQVYLNGRKYDGTLLEDEDWLNIKTARFLNTTLEVFKNLCGSEDICWHHLRAEELLVFKKTSKEGKIQHLVLPGGWQDAFLRSVWDAKAQTGNDRYRADSEGLPYVEDQLKYYLLKILTGTEPDWTGG